MHYRRSASQHRKYTRKHTHKKILWDYMYSRAVRHNAVLKTHFTICIQQNAAERKVADSKCSQPKMPSTYSLPPKRRRNWYVKMPSPVPSGSLLRPTYVSVPLSALPNSASISPFLCSSNGFLLARNALVSVSKFSGSGIQSGRLFYR